MLKEHKATVVVLNEQTKELLKLMHWGDIPEEAKYVVFSQDGMAQYLEEFKTQFLVPMPRMVMLSVYYDVDLMITE